MLNINGTFQPVAGQNIHNRAFLYGDGVFETVRVRRAKVLFLEDHYFRFMSAIRIVRMQIPMWLTMEKFESMLLETAAQNQCLDAGRVRMTVYRSGAGKYTPQSSEISYVISAEALPEPDFGPLPAPLEIEIYKDFYVAKQLLSSVKTTNKILNVMAGIFARENGYDNCLLLNDAKNVVSATNSNVFVHVDGQLLTPAISEGCLNGIMRKQIIAMATNMALTVKEGPLSAFDVQRADEVFLTNVISGIQPVGKFRKKTFEVNLAETLRLKLQESIS